MQHIHKIIFFFFLFYINVAASGQNIDILEKININRNKNLDNTFNLFSSSAGIVGAVIPASIFSVGLIHKDTDIKDAGLQIAASAISSLAISYCMKYIFDRPRPYETYTFIDNISTETSSSMPSAHAAFAFATSTSVCLQYPKWYVIAPASIWAAAVSYSRMHIGVHYPSDVLVGAALGAGVSILTYQLQKLLKPHN